jgi:hypothetical protein
MEEAASSLTTLGAVFLVVTSLLTLALPRRFAVLPLLATVCYMPLGQVVMVAGLHFYIMRLLVFVGLVRVVCRKEYVGLGASTLDKLFLAWALLTVVLGTLCKPTTEVLINRLGGFYNAAGVYFIARCWVRETAEVIAIVRAVALLLAPMGALMLVEKFTGRNIFSVFGGVPEITMVREGHVRCQGAFRHPILAGTFGATMFPLLVGLWFQEGQKKWLVALALLSAVTVAVCASSSGALLTLVLGGVCFLFWKLRHSLRVIRWGTVVLLFVVALLMDAPFWHLPARLSSVLGGTGWHRGYLIDQTISHVGEWWLVGTTYTAHWAPGGDVMPLDPDNMDITNQYVLEAVRGGLVKLGLYLVIIVQCFKILGRQIQGAGARPEGLLWWGVGVSLLTHCFSFLSVTYFDQLSVIWFWLLAVIARAASLESATHTACDGHDSQAHAEDVLARSV